MHKLLEKAHRTWKKDGIKALAQRTAEYARYKLNRRKIKQAGTGSFSRSFVDVLFINGCDSSVPHPARYRVSHQMEQLTANNMISDEVYYLDLLPEMVKYSHVFIFFRCPYTEVVGKFIKAAHALHKTVLFDIDDLVVDTRYTDAIPYVQALAPEEKRVYDDGVRRMGKTLRMCDAAITTTQRLAAELEHYVPEVFINRNTASEQMYALSAAAWKRNSRTDREFRIGYFSGSITHNADFERILPAIRKVMQAYEDVRLYIVGELDLPKELEAFAGRIVALPFMDWKELPEKIASMDVNLAPLEAGIFNEAKSENKWVEAALVKVVTIADNVGAFRTIISPDETGILCNTVEEWYDALCRMHDHPQEKERMAMQAYEYVKKHCISIYTGNALAQYIRKKKKPSAVFILPSTEISGGIMVALKHAAFLYKSGFSVTILADQPSQKWMESDGIRFPVVAWNKDPVFAGFDKAVATMWTTTLFTETHPKITDRYYLVQNFETDFYEPDCPLRIQANQSYRLGQRTKYITISRWCQRWLFEDYCQEAAYAPNGIDLENLYPVQRDFKSPRIRILIEGDCAVDYKNVDESFRITNQLDKSKYEIWYMSYNAQPKAWYRYDQFFCRVPYQEVGDIYRQCHILLKSSILESFSYPPLEMMATGGYVVALQNGGNAEYLVDGENCLIYEQGNEQAAVRAIKRIVEDERLRTRLTIGGVKTVEKRDWQMVKSSILGLYDLGCG